MVARLLQALVVGTNRVGDDPDVLAYDVVAHRLYVAAESGTVTVLDLRDRAPAPVGSGHLADGAHVVAIDPTTHRSYYPVANGSDGRPALLVRAPAWAFVSASSSSALSARGISVPPGNRGTRVART